ncbi:precorrin-2 C(20)-methyltransferase [Pannus brasiliensis CCIBt3594]|uniref:Precorrin-2 C(20)-methyltransferase n=1 Tax=Pannus brasiliensis CCIBt3594 TaxID=1427578 RepID=A0AAW9QZC2_9CHRO
MRKGILYGVSVGTGDPELITVKGLKILQNTRIIAFPAGVGARSGLAEEIIKNWLDEDQRTLKLHFPYTRDEKVLEQAWDEAAARVWPYLERGEDVAFACEGDVNFYSTFTYLALTLKQKYAEAEVRTIPGVCSPMAAASSLGIPLTMRDERLVILPALYSLEQLERAIEWADVLVLMKVGSVYSRVWEFLKRKNLLRDSWIVERATFADQVIYRDLLARPSLELSYFSLWIVRVRRDGLPKNLAAFP